MKNSALRTAESPSATNVQTPAGSQSPARTQPPAKKPPRDLSTRISEALTSRRGAWVALGVALLVIVTLFGAFSGASAPEGNDPAPADAESARVAELLAEFPNADRQSVLVVASESSGAALSEDNLASLEALGSELVPSRAQSATSGTEVQGPLVSDDGEAALLVVPIEVGASNTETAETVTALRDTVAEHAPEGLVLQVTGGPAFGADIAAAFAGADFVLLAVTIAIVAILLILTYRSPILWLVPLTVVAIADGLTGRLTAAAGAAWNLQFDAGIISVLVFGAGTNYALLLISRYREELRREDDHRQALVAAWCGTLPAILASNLTVVAALLTLIFAVIPGTHGLGVSAAIGLVIALAAVLFVLPPFLAVCGRKLFWPFIPRPGLEPRRGGVWHGAATFVARRPVTSLVAGLALLAVMATGLLGTTVGLDQSEKFRVPSESAAGLEVLSEHFPAGEAQPIWVVADSDAAVNVVAATTEVEGVVRAHPVETTDDGALTKIMVTSEYAPSTPESLAQIGELREAVHAVSGDTVDTSAADGVALVGGAVATDVDARADNARDFLVIAPLVLGVSFVVLVGLLRALVAPVLLMLVNVVSAAAAVGAGAWLSRILFDQHALDLQVPLLGFLLLVALGIDYTIFLVHRARTEARTLGTRQGMIEAVSRTGGVITSAGIVLAGVFAALGVLPLVTLGQLGVIVGLGVIVDTLVVRTVIVPAVFSLLGDRVWWPSRVHPERIGA